MNKVLEHLFRGGIHSNRSEVFIRNARDLRLHDLRELSLGLNEILTMTIRGDHDWPALARSVGETFKFPSDVEHSFDALQDWIGDLSWMNGGHYFIALDISKTDAEANVIWLAIDALIGGIMEHNKEPRIKMTLLLLV